LTLSRALQKIINNPPRRKISPLLGARHASPLASPTRRLQPMFYKLGRVIPRAAGALLSASLISTISKINILIIIANIVKRYGTFMFISIPSTFLCGVEIFAAHPVYICYYLNCAFFLIYIYISDSATVSIHESLSLSFSCFFF